MLYEEFYNKKFRDQDWSRLGKETKAVHSPGREENLNYVKKHADEILSEKKGNRIWLH